MSQNFYEQHNRIAQMVSAVGNGTKCILAIRKDNPGLTQSDQDTAIFLFNQEYIATKKPGTLRLNQGCVDIWDDDLQSVMYSYSLHLAEPFTYNNEPLEDIRAQALTCQSQVFFYRAPQGREQYIKWISLNAALKLHPRPVRKGLLPPKYYITFKDDPHYFQPILVSLIPLPLINYDDCMHLIRLGPDFSAKYLQTSYGVSLGLTSPNGEITTIQPSDLPNIIYIKKGTYKLGNQTGDIKLFEART